MTVIKHLERHAELDSTNNRAALLAAEANLPLPALVVAERQTAGRGRGSNAWWSSAGALTFSLLIDASHDLSPARWPLVSLGAAIAVANVLEGLLPERDIRLKWPNDVFANGRKICGILVEAPPVRPARLVVGIGLNVNNSLRAAPEEIRARATSCCDESSASFDPERVLELVVEETLAQIEAVASGALNLAERWSPRCLLAGRQVVIGTPATDVRGTCQGIDAEGALLVQTGGEVRRLFAGVVKQW
jgi:BirA family biotin operon repressor/biotin-[acetyl-CoA-carboxylase] ligase